MTDTITRLSPALGRVVRAVPDDIDAQLNELASQFLNDAKAIDPTIKGGWICNTLLLENRPPSGAVAGVYFERDEAPLVRKRRIAE